MKSKWEEIDWLLLKKKILHYYGIYQNDKMTPLRWNGGSISLWLAISIWFFFNYVIFVGVKWWRVK